MPQESLAPEVWQPAHQFSRAPWRSDPPTVLPRLGAKGLSRRHSRSQYSVFINHE
jgi:hypothetical protein